MRTFILPDLGEGLQDAEIVAWHVGIGDEVAADQPLVSVETAKAVVEVPAPWAGRITTLHGKPGNIIAVGAPLADIDTASDVRDAGTVVGTVPRLPDFPAAVEEHKFALTDRDGRSKVSPAVRKLAQDLHVPLAGISGTGPGGLITSEDVRRAPATPAQLMEGFEELRGVRRAMSDAMATASTRIVPATVTDEAIIDAWPSSADPTIRLIRAVAAGCKAAPSLNAWYDPDRRARRLHDHVDLGIAMETEDGLFAPVLRTAGDRSDEDLRRGLNAMKSDVTARKVKLSELRGQTITLSNFGILGGLTAALTIVPPQVAILGAGRIHAAARVVDGTVKSVRVVPLSLTFDHRAVTGAEAIAFLNAVVRSLIPA